MKINTIGISAFVALSFLASCNTLEVSNPNNITDEQIIEILQGDDETKKEMILQLVGTGLESNFNISGQTYLGYSDYNLTSQIDQDFAMNLRGNDVVLGLKQNISSYHATEYNLVKTFYNTDNTKAYFNHCALILTNANKALLYLTPEVAEASPKSKTMRGQALVVRAYAYLMLMEKFQPAYMNGGKEKQKASGMPIYKQYGTNSPAEISTAAETYDFIISDLKEAITDLTDSGYTSNLKDIDLGVAQFLLARAALEYGDWKTCIAAAEDVTKHYKTFIAEANYGAKDADFSAICSGSKEVKAEDNAFITLDTNVEAIMGFVSGDGSNTYDNSWKNVFGNGLAGSSLMPVLMDNRLLAKIDDNDFRKDNITTQLQNYTWITDKDGKTYMNEIPVGTSLKWASTICKGVSARNHELTCDNYIFRSSEAYLMLAEAYAQDGDETKAKETLNILLAARTKAGKTPLTCDTYSSMSGLSALDMVKLQTRIELWCEGGREFYNNKRWNIAVDRSGSTNHHSINSTLTMDEMVLDIPRSEKSTNTNWVK